MHVLPASSGDVPDDMDSRLVVLSADYPYCRDAGNFAEEVISHLAGLVGAEVTSTLEIEANMPKGASDSVVRTVTENRRALRFTS